MSGYIHGQTIVAQPGPMLSVEQVRRRNAQLNQELMAIEAINKDIAERAAKAKEEVSKAHAELTKTIREVLAIRGQSDRIAQAQAAIRREHYPEPVYGGREGLELATKEILEYEFRDLRLGKPPRPVLGPSHGTGRKYDQGCRCEPCKEYKRGKTLRYAANRRHRQEQVAA